MPEEKEYKVTITGTWTGLILAESAEEAKMLAFRDEFDPAYLKDKISTTVEEVLSDDQ